jgi:hypothetical protein
MKKMRPRKSKITEVKIKQSIRRVNSEINNLLKNLKRHIPEKKTVKNKRLFSSEIIKDIKREGLCQNISFLQDSLAKETLDKRVNLAAESIGNWIFATFEIKKRFVEGEILQIKKSEIEEFTIPNLSSHPLSSTVSIKITQPGFQHKGIEIAKPLAEILN